ncbi:MAG: hypothetical protein MJZ22_05335 [Candidatus Saccharibacteria bacterium]|nr:hypothetical protein [Candidatus Saccharibacteria bacterium]
MAKKVLNEVSWEAEEYIVHKHDVVWYICLFLVGAGLSALAVFLTQWTFLALIVVSIVAILTSNLRPPRKISYKLDKTGLSENNNLHKYEEFRAFGILKEEGHYSAILIPKKRFGTSIKVYFPEVNGEAIVDMLGARLPMEPVKLDIIDKIVNFLRI